MKIPVSNLHLIMRKGPQRGQTFSITSQRVSIGRDTTCDIKLDDPKISRVHAFIEVIDTEVYFRDNNSTNGSRINDETVSHRKLEAGDVIQLGAIELALLEHSDSQTISFTHTESEVTSAFKTSDFNVDQLANKFDQIFDYYKDFQPDMSPVEQVDLIKTQRLATSLKTLYGVTTDMSKLLPEDELLAVVAAGLFEVFGGAENLVILLRNDDDSAFSPRYARDRKGNTESKLTVSSTVLNRAVKERATIVANDAAHDNRFSSSMSIVGFSVKSVICAPLVVGERVIGALYLDNRQTDVQYDDMDVEILTAFANQAAIALDNARLCDTLQESYHQMLQSLVKTIEAKDAYTMGHTQRVKEYSLGIARQLAFSAERLEKLAMAAELHDIGKIGISEGVINKPGALTDLEYENMKEHVIVGVKILKPIVYLEEVLPWIRGHHERWDGSGYPDGLKGDDCPLEARVLAAADAFDAMTSQRSYNKPLTFEQAMERIEKARGTHFDPKIVDAMKRYVATLVAQRERKSASQRAGMETVDSEVEKSNSELPETVRPDEASAGLGE